MQVNGIKGGERRERFVNLNQVPETYLVIAQQVCVWCRLFNR